MIFYDPIIAQTIEKLLQVESPPTTTPTTTSTNTDIASAVDVGTPISPSYMWSLQYRGRETDNLVRQLRKVPSANITTVLTLRKLNTVIPSLKSPVDKKLRSRLVYRIECPGCQASYVGCTIRHLCVRFSEHGNVKCPVGKHFMQCISCKPHWDDIQVVQTTPRTVDYLLALEALYINEQNPTLNTRDEYHSRQLTLNF